MNVARHAGAALVLAIAASGHAAPAASVTPSGDTVPENLLRIELHLARPLPRALAMDRVHLLDGDGQDIPGAFLDLPLPGDDGRTIALLLHPGRVKTGVGANLALGRALHAGETVTLVVDDPQLGRPLRQRWRVEAAARQAFAGPGMTIDAPRTGTRAALQVRFGTPLTASSIRLLAVRGPAGERVAGSSTFRDGETAWRFVPARRWRAGEYALSVHPRLEDVAGNRNCAPFEAAALADVECTSAERVFAIRP